MKIIIETPTRAYLHDYDSQDLESMKTTLFYRNTANQHQLKRHYNNKWFRSKNRVAWEIQLEKLKKSVENVLVFEDNGRYYIRPGSLPHIDTTGITIENKVVYPKPKKVAWAKMLPFELHDYQEISVQELMKVLHGNVELCTAAGKSAILLKLCREMGLRCAIIAPSKSIFYELLEKFEHHLGKDKVGAFGDGKKKIGKLFTICISDSIANVKPGTKEWDFFSKLDMMGVDESHTWGAETLDEICHGILADVPYRFFFSGTQTRGDGAEKLLQSIIGKTVHKLTTAEAVKKGFIGKHNYTIVKLNSSNPNFSSMDVLEMKRIHFLNNRNIGAFAAKLANADFTTNRRQTLILVEELSQIAMVTKLLTVPYAYAHSESKPARLAELGLTKVDSAESVEKFNKGEVGVLIGTSCIATGTNIYPTHNTVNWVGGASEIKTKQGTIGRSVRLGKSNPWADKCLPKEYARIWDFDVQDIYVLQNHLKDRLEYYSESFYEGEKEIKFIKI